MAFPKKCLSIDIGNEQIKIGDLHHNGNKISIVNYAMVETPNNAINDGSILNKEAISNALKNALLDAGIKTKEVVFSISSSKVITREVELPNLKPKKLKAIIDINAEEYFPVNLSDYTMDYTVVDVVDSEDGKKAKVIIFAALTSMLSEYISVASLAGLKMVGMDYAGQSIVNFIKHEKIEGTSLILDLGSESTMVTIMSDNVVKFSRNLLFGTRLINENIANHFSVTYEEAVKLSGERQLLSQDNTEISYLANDVTGAMDQILNGVSRLVDYFTSRNKEPISRIYLVGGGSQVYGVTEYIEKFFNIKTIVLKEAQHIHYTGKADFTNKLIRFTNVIGAILSDINLAPNEIKNKEQIDAKKRTKYLLAVLVFVVLAGIYSIPFTKLQSVKNDNKALQADILKAQEILVIKSDYETAVKKADFRKAILALSTSKSDHFLSVIEAMEAAMPSEVYYTAISNTETDVLISCNAKDKASIANIITFLKTITLPNENGEQVLLFSDVYVPSVAEVDATSGNPMYTFQISCKYR